MENEGDVTVGVFFHCPLERSIEIWKSSGYDTCFTNHETLRPLITLKDLHWPFVHRSQS